MHRPNPEAAVRMMPWTLVALVLLAGCASAGSAPAALPVLDPTGFYTFSTLVQGAPVDGQMEITGEAGSYSGTVYTDVTGELPIVNVAMEGSQLFVTADTPQGPVDIRMVFDGDTFTGDWSMGTDGSAIRGRRIRR